MSEPERIVLPLVAIPRSWKFLDVRSVLDEVAILVVPYAGTVSSASYPSVISGAYYMPVSATWRLMTKHAARPTTDARAPRPLGV